MIMEALSKIALNTSCFSERKNAPHTGTNSLVEYAHLFADGSDWVSLTTDEAVMIEDKSAKRDENAAEFERTLRREYEMSKQSDHRRSTKLRALSGGAMFDDDNYDHPNRPGWYSYLF